MMARQTTAHISPAGLRQRRPAGEAKGRLRADKFQAKRQLLRYSYKQFLDNIF